MFLLTSLQTNSKDLYFQTSNTFACTLKKYFSYMTCICPPEGPFKVKQTKREIIEREGNLSAAAQTDRHLWPLF